MEMYFEKGYVERRDFIPDADSTVGPFYIKFTPLKVLEVALIADFILKDDTVVNTTKHVIEMMKKHVVDSSVMKPDGTKVDFSKEDEIANLNPEVFHWISDQIKGVQRKKGKDIEEEEDIKNF